MVNIKDEIYPEKMLEDYNLVLEAYPQISRLREKAAQIINNHFAQDKDIKIIDIGSGTGEELKNILKQNQFVKIIAVDNDKRMIKRLEKNLKGHIKNKNVIPVCQDIFKYIKTLESSAFDAVTSFWTIHNFTKAARRELLKEIYRILKPNGIFVNMDKYVYDNPEKEQKSFDETVARLKKISNKQVAHTAITHEQEDRHPDIIMKENESAVEMKKIGFINIKFHLRITRESVMSCVK